MAAQHLAFPLRLAPGGNLLSLEQDSDAEVANSIAIALSYPIGSRRGSPDYGTPPLLFETGPLDLAAVRAAVSRSEPRAGYEVTISDELLKGGVGRLTVGFDQSAGG